MDRLYPWAVSHNSNRALLRFVFVETGTLLKLKILKSPGGFYDGLAFSPTGPNRFHIN